MPTQIIEKIKNIKINRLLLWQWGVVVFLLLVVIILTINIHLLIRLESEITEDDVGIVFVPEQIEEKLLRDAILRIAEKEKNFEDALSVSP
ncbi:MAG: hypothetical protein COT67_02085 [Candidatus Tagabacteria bacterium CG09_land_8_20_14_0_10_41_14]|uniref:Uncharacterized protein n=2 Tax=Candidatus Tagaibacteriota TaxID=1817918 RepID=A0A2H0WL46_9BACT|nr:MAG: hypothetical protein COT67_02085 [Candidatus Tagabacteria bacterium CG09_land_8_20_14_0_10_41_14]PJE72904.1 MAG: hypothetical protein COV00_02730 [Candidatus Tagabacteria bacterium CG10_big_fil_rev_8_21_14_0_10_40_13]